MKKHILALSCALFLSACAADQPAPVAKADYVLPPKINLDVQNMTFVDHSTQQSNSPYNTFHFQPTISDAIRQWSTDRLGPVGQTGQGTVIVTDASLTSQALAMQGGMNDWFTRQQASKYIAHAEVEIDLQGREGAATVTAQATRYESLPENPSPAERQRAYFDVLNALMRDLGQNMERAIQAHAGTFIITAPIGNVMSPLSPAITQAPISAAPVSAAPISAAPMTDYPAQ
jgi:hypothetical protein